MTWTIIITHQNGRTDKRTCQQDDPNFRNHQLIEDVIAVIEDSFTSGDIGIDGTSGNESVPF
jgi:hypothetical protein